MKCPRCASENVYNAPEPYGIETRKEYSCWKCHCIWTQWQQDEIEKLKGIKPEPLNATYPIGTLPRFGVRWNGPQEPMAVQMDDGYWTPYHIAQERIAALEQRLHSADFWGKFVYENGANPEQIRNELMDYHDLLGRVAKVYCHVTGGMISKQNTLAEVVIEVADEQAEKQAQEAVKEATEELQKWIEALEEGLRIYIKELKDRGLDDTSTLNVAWRLSKLLEGK